MTDLNIALAHKAIDINGKKYVQVKDRIIALGEHYAGKYSICTDYQYLPERKMWIVKAWLQINGQVFTGMAQEVESNNQDEINYRGALENAETSAVGRACAMAGIGVLDAIASVEELVKAQEAPQTTQAVPRPQMRDMPTISSQEVRQREYGACKKCDLIGAVIKLRKTTQYGSTHLLKCSCGQKSWLFPSKLVREPETLPVS